MNLFDLFKPREQPIDVSRQALRHAIDGRMAHEAANDAFARGLICTPHLDKIAARESGIAQRMLAISEAFENAQQAK